MRARNRIEPSPAAVDRRSAGKSADALPRGCATMARISRIRPGIVVGQAPKRATPSAIAVFSRWRSSIAKGNARAWRAPDERRHSVSSACGRAPEDFFFRQWRDADRQFCQAAEEISGTLRRGPASLLIDDERSSHLKEEEARRRASLVASSTIAAATLGREASAKARAATIDASITKLNICEPQGARGICSRALCRTSGFRAINS